jgi:hypothetical protein
MYVSTNTQLMRFQNCFGVLSRLCHGKGWTTYSHFKCLRWQQNTDSAGLTLCDAHKCRWCVFLLDRSAPALCSSAFLLDFPKVIIAAIVCLAPAIDCYPPRHSAYYATLAQRRAKRCAGAYRSSRKKKTPQTFIPQDNRQMQAGTQTPPKPKPAILT